MSLDFDLSEAIRKNLPAEVSAHLRQRLELADSLEKEAPQLRSKMADAESRALSTSTLAKEKCELEEEQAKLTLARVAMTHESELNKLRLANAEARRADMREVVGLLLGNRIVRERVQEQVPVDAGSSTMSEYSTQDGCNKHVVMPSGEILQDTETKTETEET